MDQQSTPINGHTTLPQQQKPNATTTNNGTTDFQPVATSSIENGGTASQLPPRPLDYDDYWYQADDGFWYNEYDDLGYEFADDTEEILTVEQSSNEEYQAKLQQVQQSGQAPLQQQQQQSYVKPVNQTDPLHRAADHQTSKDPVLESGHKPQIETAAEKPKAVQKQRSTDGFSALFSSGTDQQQQVKQQQQQQQQSKDNQLLQQQEKQKQELQQKQQQEQQLKQQQELLKKQQQELLQKQQQELLQKQQQELLLKQQQELQQKQHQQQLEEASQKQQQSKQKEPASVVNGGKPAPTKVIV